jgi:hypothetical protein
MYFSSYKWRPKKMPRGRPRKNKNIVVAAKLPKPIARIKKVYRVEMATFAINASNQFIWALILAKTRRDKYALQYEAEINNVFKQTYLGVFDAVKVQNDINQAASVGYRIVPDDVVNNNEKWFNKFVRQIKSDVTGLP